MLIKIFLALSLSLALVFTATGCGSDAHDVEDYGQHPVPVVLSNPEQHMGGYGRNECLVCHNSALNIHRSAGSPIDADKLNEAVRNNGEAKFCLTCHGSNGT